MLSKQALVECPELSAGKPVASEDPSGRPQGVGDGFPTWGFLPEHDLEFFVLLVGFESGLCR